MEELQPPLPSFDPQFVSTEVAKFPWFDGIRLNEQEKMEIREQAESDVNALLIDFDRRVNDGIINWHAVEYYGVQPMGISFSSHVIPPNIKKGLVKLKEYELAYGLGSGKYPELFKSYQETGLPIPSRWIAGELISASVIPVFASPSSDNSSDDVLIGHDCKLRTLHDIPSTAWSRRYARENINKVLPQASNFQSMPS
ncbi:MAG: hypothetical protein Q9222_002398 [Ikaeria aurantiellina]